MLELLLDAFPGQMDGVQVPIHPKARRPWAASLVARGVRVHPELMEQFPVPGSHPEAGWLNPHKWVGREEYDEYAASRSEGTHEQMQAMLQAIDPAMAQRISHMTDAEKAAAREQQAPQMQAVFERMQEVGRQHWEAQRDKEAQ
jgi:hypothetical protein